VMLVPMEVNGHAWAMLGGRDRWGLGQRRCDRMGSALNVEVGRR
jgi:hypothetical protein